MNQRRFCHSALRLTKRAALLHNVHLRAPADKPLLYLIGVNHALQFKRASVMLTEPESVQKKRETFTAHVAEMIDKLDIEILAEEFSEEAKRKPAGRETALSVLEQFGKNKGIEHRFCDPDGIQKQGLGIEVDPEKETQSDRDKRERVWLCRIGDCRHRRVLFVCGDDHYDAFAQKLAAAGFTVQRGPRYRISEEEFYDF